MPKSKPTTCSTTGCAPAEHDTANAAETLSDEALSKLCKALGHPIRIRILRILRARQSCVCGELVEELPLAQSTISQHLKVLKDSGLVIGEVDGPRRCYCIAPQALSALQQGLLNL